MVNDNTYDAETTEANDSNHGTTMLVLQQCAICKVSFNILDDLKDHIASHKDAGLLQWH